MKKTLIMTIIIAMILSMVSVVNAAAGMTASASKVNKKGDTVTVTVNFGKTMEMSDFELTWDTSVFKYVKSDADIEKTTSNGVRLGTYVAPEGRDSVTVTLEALKNSGEISVGFKALDFSDMNSEDATVTINSKAKITIGNEKKQDDGKKDDSGEIIAKPGELPNDDNMPQTGVNVASYVAVAGIILVVIAGAVIVKKYQK